MVRTKTVARKAGGGTAPTQPVLTQDVEAEVARATEAAQHVARLRAMLDDDDEAVVVSSRPNAPKAKRSRSQKKGKEEKEKEEKEKEIQKRVEDALKEKAKGGSEGGSEVWL